MQDEGAVDATREETEFLRTRLDGAERYITLLLADQKDLAREFAEVTRELARMNAEVVHVYRKYTGRDPLVSSAVRSRGFDPSFIPRNRAAS